MKQIGMFDEENRLEKLDRAINWEMFRPLLNHAFKQVPKGAGDRPLYDYGWHRKQLIQPVLSQQMAKLA